MTLYRRDNSKKGYSKVKKTTTNSTSSRVSSKKKSSRSSSSSSRNPSTTKSTLSATVFDAKTGKKKGFLVNGKIVKELPKKTPRGSGGSGRSRPKTPVTVTITDTKSGVETKRVIDPSTGKTLSKSKRQAITQTKIPGQKRTTQQNIAQINELMRQKAISAAVGERLLRDRGRVAVNVEGDTVMVPIETTRDKKKRELELKKFLLGTQTNITELFNYIHETLPFQSKLNDNEINVNDIDVNSKQEIDLLIQLSKADLQKMFFDRILDTTSNFVKKIKEELTEKNSLILYRGTVLSPHDFHSTVLGEKDNVGIHFSFSEHIASDFASNPNPEVVNSVLKADIKLSEIDVLSTLLYENLGIFEEEEIRLFDFSTFQALEIENSIQGCKYPINKEFKGHQNNLLFEKLQNIYFEFTSKTINFQELQNSCQQSHQLSYRLNNRIFVLLCETFRYEFVHVLDQIYLRVFPEK